MKEEFLKILERSREQQKNRPPNIVVHGPPKAGKTELAATASGKWSNREPVLLDDMLWGEFDEGGTETLSCLGVELPYLVSFQACLEARKNDVESALLLFSSILTGLARDTPSIRYVVLDTISMLDQFLLSACVDNAKDTRRGFGDMLALHRRLYSALAKLPQGKIFLCHSRVMTASDNLDAKKAKQSRSATMADIQPAISGSARVLYLGNAALVAVLRRVAGVKGAKRILYPNGIGDFEGGSRWEGLLEKEEPPHLGELIKKARKNER